MSEFKAKILLVEDDLSLALVTKDSLELHGFQVVHCDNGEKGWTAFSKQDFDVCLLDVMMPKMDGFTLAEKIREKNHLVPLIFVTAKSLQEDKIAGLKIGADDYITKPFNVEEVILKIEVFLRRTKPDLGPQVQPTKFSIGTYYFDFDNLTLERNSEIRQLTLREGELLRYFCLSPNVLVKREDILKKIWGQDDYFLGRSMDVFITRIRKYLKEDESLKIENIPGVGFKFITG
jgi:DNA-binding response OmpR family regulator